MFERSLHGEHIDGKRGQWAHPLLTKMVSKSIKKTKDYVYNIKKKMTMEISIIKLYGVGNFLFSIFLFFIYF